MEQRTADLSRITLGSQHSSTKRYENILAAMLSDTRAAVVARRRAAAQGLSPAEAAHATLAPASSLTPGSSEWVDEWASGPARSSRGGHRHRSRGHGRSGGRRQLQRSEGEDGFAAAAPAPAAAAAAAAAAAVPGSAAGLSRQSRPLALASAPVDEGLKPLPPFLLAQPWAAVRDSTLGTGEDCAICLQEMGTEEGETAAVATAAAPALVVQLSCKHTYCDLCVRQLLERAQVGGSAACCPQCRM